MGTLLNYREAGKRVGRSHRSIRLWRRQGMPMGWRVGEDDQRERVVDEDVLLQWFREKMQNDPVHQAKMRRVAIENGLPVPAPIRRKPAPRTTGLDLTSAGPSAAVSTPPDAPVLSDQETDSGSEQRRVFVEPVIELPPVMAREEYADLIEAMKETQAACDGLEVFTQDHNDPELLQMMAGVCGGCELLLRCRKFANKERPASGFWAGRPSREWSARSRVA